MRVRMYICMYVEYTVKTFSQNAGCFFLFFMTFLSPFSCFISCCSLILNHLLSAGCWLLYKLLLSTALKVLL